MEQSAREQWLRVHGAKPPTVTPHIPISPLPQAGEAGHVPFSTETVPYFMWWQQIPTEMSPCFISGTAENSLCI